MASAPALRMLDELAPLRDQCVTSAGHFQRTTPRGAQQLYRPEAGSMLLETCAADLYATPCAIRRSSPTEHRCRSRQLGVVVRAMNIVFVAAEVSPWSKTGGLGDVVGGLPIELAKRGHKVYSIAPRYRQLPS